MQKTSESKKEECFLKQLSGVEDLAEKKTKIYSRLLTDAALAKDMESQSARHTKRRQALTLLISGELSKRDKEQNGQGMDETTDGEEEK